MVFGAFWNKSATIADDIISYKDNDLKLANSFAKKLASTFLNNLEERFDDLEKLDIWSVLDLETIKSPKIME